MNDYDLTILQPNEFEHLTRDLLQKKENIFVESFTPGKDKGIDLRFATIRGRNAIVQVKRYKEFKALKSALVKEVGKVQTLSPDRYILSTTVGLTPQNKEEIMGLFSPFIKDSSDILGRDDINNLLGQYPDIERQYYKLWLGSSAVLEDILNKRINNWSAIELETIRRDVSTYVMNDSFNKALDILKKNRYVIISGIPGIGKTTLARMMVNYILSEGYEEFVMLETIGDAAQKLIDGKKQVFFYDDFLGSTSFQNDEKGFDHKLVAFIEKVKNEPDKLFILSTREYILAEAKRYYDSFSTNNIELAKCVLDLSDYTEGIRAKILYNHLSMAELPLIYVQAILENRNYLRLIKHSNFNPRIIQTFLNQKLYLQVPPSDFVSSFVDFFDRPFAVWEMAFMQLPPIAQYSLFVRMSMGENPVLLTDWYYATKCFVQGSSVELNLSFDDLSWEKTLKIMEGTFIISKRIGGKIVSSYQNPSVFDFLVSRIRDLGDVQGLIIRESAFAEQLYNPFSCAGYPSFFDYGRIKLDKSLWPVLESAYKRHLLNLNFCTLKDRGYGGQSYATLNLIDYLYKMALSFGELFKQKPDLLSEVVTLELMEDPHYSLMMRMSLFDKLPNETKQHLDLEQLSEHVIEEADCLDDFVNIMSLLTGTITGQEALDSIRLVEKVEGILGDELSAIDSAEECDRISDDLSMLVKYIPSLNETVWQSEIYELKSSITKEPDYDDDFSHDYSISHYNEDRQYDEMFSCLLVS